MPKRAPNRIASALTLMMAPVCLLAGGCRQTVVLGPGGSDGATGEDASPFGDHGGFGSCDRLFPMIRSPDVILMVDRSDVMQTTFGNTTRLLATQGTLVNLVAQYQTVVRFGYGEFPSASPLSCGPGSGDGCCAGDISPPTKNNLMAFSQYIHPCDAVRAPCLSPQRPVSDALADCRQKYMGFDENGRNRYVVLVTGGEPNCGGDGSSGSACSAAQNEAAKLNNSEIRTYVVVVGAEWSSSECLDRLASAGGAPRGTQPSYYLASGQGDLTSQLSTIIGGIAQDACHIDISPPGGDADRLMVYLNGQPIKRDGANGWDLDNGSTFKITLNGDACQAYIRGQVQSVEIFSGRGC